MLENYYCSIKFHFELTLLFLSAIFLNFVIFITFTSGVCTGESINIFISLYYKKCLRENIIQKQPFKDVIKESYSENMQQIYRRTPMPKYDFNKVAMQIYWSHTLAWVFSCKFAAFFQNTCSQEHLLMAAFDNND